MSRINLAVKEKRRFIGSDTTVTIINFGMMGNKQSVNYSPDHSPEARYSMDIGTFTRLTTPLDPARMSGHPVTVNGGERDGDVARYEWDTLV